MGGGGRFPYPKDVWSPAGGWWAYPRAWRSNTAVAFGLIIGLCIPVFIYSERKMVRVGEPVVPIPWRPGIKVREENE